MGSGKPKTTSNNSKNHIETKNNILKIAHSFVGVVKSELRTPEVQNGWLACAKYVSLVLKEAGYLNQIFISVDGLINHLKQNGWQKTNSPTPGSIVVWGKTPTYSHKHIGIVLNDKEALNNSSYDKMAVKSPIYGERPIESFFTRPWVVTRYYTPIPGQKRYYHGSYAADFKINCQGDCLVTASNYRLSEKDAFKVAACPKEIKFGTIINLPHYGAVVCRDRGGAIKENRIDLWAGIGDEGLNNILGKK